MSKKPKPRTLGAEPLEERLPISSSAAGVLFGFGLAQEPGVERSATPGYESSQTPRTESVAQQSAPIDLTLDLQLDALAVDLFHAEESLLDTISSASPDPFVLTPLTPSAVLGDTTKDAHKELGDELLLFQISTFEVNHLSFEPVTPEREPVSHDFGDALTPPEDLTAYGYSPIANELQEKDDEGGTRCGGGCGGYAACLTGGYTTACSTPHTHASSPSGSSYTYSHSDHTMYMFQDSNNTATINATMSWTGAGTGTITVYAGGTQVAQVTSGNGLNGFNSFSYTYNWAKPSGVSNDAVSRDITFVFAFSGGSSVTLYAHIGYAEVLVAFAGRGDFHQSSATGPKTLQNTLIVGQQLHAKLFYDAPKFTLTSNSWTAPWGGMIVKGYKTEYDEGAVIHFDASDWTSSEFKCYYSSSVSGAIGGITNTMKFTDPHGDIHTIAGGASYYLEAPTVSKFTPKPTAQNPAVSMEVTNNIPISFHGDAGLYFSTASNGITWEISVESQWGGQFALIQVVTTAEREIRYYSPNLNFWSNGKYYWPKTHNLLDFGMDFQNVYYLGDIWDVNPPAPVSTGDRPSHFSVSKQVGHIEVYDEFRTTLMYIAPGSEIIPVALRAHEWKWEGLMARLDPNNWAFDSSSWSLQKNTYQIGSVYVTSQLPTWSGNALDFLANPKHLVGWVPTPDPNDPTKPYW